MLAEGHIDACYQTVDRLLRNEVVMNPTSITPVGVISTSDDRNINCGGTAQVDLQFHPGRYTIGWGNYLTDNLLASTITMMSERFEVGDHVA